MRDCKYIETIGIKVRFFDGVILANGYEILATYML